MAFDPHSKMAQVVAKVDALERKHAARVRRAQDVQAVRRGDFDQVAFDLFNDDWPRPVVANLIDVSARDMAAVLAPLPAFNCSATSSMSEAARKFAEKRTRIVNGYLSGSRLQAQMSRGADQYNSYGMLTTCVEPDFEAKAPRIFVEDSYTVYPVWNRLGDTVAVAKVFLLDEMDLCAQYPEVEQVLRERERSGSRRMQKIKVVKFVDKDVIALYLPQLDNAVVELMPNPLGRCYYVCTKKPTLDDEIRGSFDDLIWVQLAAHNMQMLAMAAADKAVNAPVVLPMDVSEVNIGPDATLRTNNPAGVGRLRLDVPPTTWGVIDHLRSDMRIGAMSPEARSGNIDASVVTGRGVQQLMEGFSTQIADAQAQFAEHCRRVVELCFVMDETFWPEVERTVRGNDAGVPYEIKYRPSKDIRGDHTVDVQYGFLAGLDPNRALVYALQAQAAGLISKDFARRQLPAGINATEEERRIEVEAMRNSILQSVSALSQSIPQLVANGMDPAPIVAAVAEIVVRLQKGDPIEEVVKDVFAPPPPPPQVDPGTTADATAGAAPGEGSASGFGPSGLPSSLTPGMATEGPNARPDLQQLFAGLSSAGNPVLQGGVSRFAPTQGG